ncbi:hypothetical protein ACNOYE_02525 [Nannocystaceae bacterium ST9]
MSERHAFARLESRRERVSLGSETITDLHCGHAHISMWGLGRRRSEYEDPEQIALAELRCSGMVPSDFASCKGSGVDSLLIRHARCSASSVVEVTDC